MIVVLVIITIIIIIITIIITIATVILKIALTIATTTIRNKTILLLPIKMKIINIIYVILK